MLRRKFTFGFAGALGASLAGAAFGQAERASEWARPVRNFKDMVLLDVSPDGRQLCLYPSETFEPPRGLKRGIVRDATPLSKHTLMVIELGSWTILSSTELRGASVNVSFFADSTVLYAELEAERQGDRSGKPGLLIDFAKTKVEETFEPGTAGRSTTSYRALARQLLLGEQRNGGGKDTASLFLAQLPGYQETRRVLLTEGRKPVDGASMISSDRKFVAFATDRTLQLRRTEDLSVVWAQETAGKQPSEKLLSVSATGSIVAAPVERKGLSSVIVYDGATGKEVTAISSETVTGLAVSPDGRYLAIGVAAKDKSDLVPTVRVHEISSGRSVEVLTHDRVPVGKDASSRAAFGPRGIQFTVDGKFLLTSTMHTRAWQLT
ncbi:MAG: hypothetical protein ABL967_07750 [Bryobacteraceae bacterium]